MISKEVSVNTQDIVNLNDRTNWKGTSVYQMPSYQVYPISTSQPQPYISQPQVYNSQPQSYVVPVSSDIPQPIYVTEVSSVPPVNAVNQSLVISGNKPVNNLSQAVPVGT